MNALVTLALVVTAAGAKRPPMPVEQAVREWRETQGGLKPEFRWQLSRLIGDIETAGVVWADGMPVKMHAVRVKGSAESVRDEVLASFKVQGLYVPAEQPQPVGQLQVTAVDGRFLIAYTALISPAGETCTVVLTETNVALGLTAPRKDVGVPLFPGAQSVMVSRSEDFEQVSFETGGAKPEEIEAFYAQVLTGSGYRLIEPRTWQGPRDRITVTVLERSVVVQKTAALEEKP
jgi:hypothetical protein